MTWRPLLGLALLASSGAQRALPRPSRAGEPPSVLLVVLDDVGWPEWGSMPVLQDLAAQGVTFTRAYGAPMCCPGRYELLFGRWPRRDGLGGNALDAWDIAAPRLPLELVSLPELFGATHRSGLVGKWHLGRAPSPAPDSLLGGPSWHGFQAWTAGSVTALSLGPGASGYRDWWRVEGETNALETLYATNVQRDGFVAWWEGTAGPRFGVLAWSAAHDPWDRIPGYSQTAWLTLTDRQRYELVVGYADAQLGAVLEHVDRSRTFVVVACDNGTPNAARPIGGEFGRWKFTTYEGALRVPLVVVGPGVETGTTDRLVMLNDVGATLAELCALELAGFEDSCSFADALGPWPGSPARAFAFAERYGTIDDRAAIERDWKLRLVDGAPLFYRITAPGVEVPLVPSAAIQARLVAELESLPPRAP